MSYSEKNTESNPLQRPVVLMPCVSLHFLRVIEAVKDLGGYVITVDHDPNAPCHKLADESYAISANDLESILAIAQERGVTRAIATSETSMRVVAYVAEKMGLPRGISYENVICATHKDAMRKRFEEHKVPIPGYVICKDYSSFKDAVESFGYYCVVKPSDNASSRGVMLLDGTHDSDILPNLYEQTRKYSSTGITLVEERIDGPEVSVESITLDGVTSVITITDKITTPAPYCAEVGHTEPSRLPVDVQESIVTAAKQAISAIGIKNGPSHTEVKVGLHGAKVIEIGARPGGDYITAKLVPLSTGVDFQKAVAAIGMGVNPIIEVTETRGAAVRFISVPEPGVISEINVDDRLYEIEGMAEFELYRKVGDQIQASFSNNDRIGHVVCVGNNAEDAARSVDKALSYINTKVISMSDDVQASSGK